MPEENKLVHMTFLTKLSNAQASKRRAVQGSSGTAFRSRHVIFTLMHACRPCQAPVSSPSAPADQPSSTAAAGPPDLEARASVLVSGITLASGKHCTPDFYGGIANVTAEAQHTRGKGKQVVGFALRMPLLESCQPAGASVHHLVLACFRPMTAASLARPVACQMLNWLFALAALQLTCCSCDAWHAVQHSVLSVHSHQSSTGPT